MPRNGDGSSDNGPIEGQELLHGASGDVCLPTDRRLKQRLTRDQQKTLQHTKHVAPMPEVEAGDGKKTPQTCPDHINLT